MALNCKVGSFTANTSTGSQAVTGVGFQPALVIIFGSVSDGAASRRRAWFGASSGASAEYGVGISSADASSSSASDRLISSTALVQIHGSAGEGAAADLTSFDSDGFTLNWTSVSGLGRTLYYMALGGTDLTNAKVGNFTGAGSTGNQAVTGVGFQPDCLLLFGGITSGTSAILGIGAGTGSGAQWYTAISDQNGQATMNTARRQRTDKIYARLFGTTLGHEGSLVSLDSDGFTINWTTAIANAVGYIALKGGQFKVGSISQKTSIGTQGYTGVGFQPVGLLLTSFCNVASTATEDHARWSIGAANSATSRAAAWWGSSDNVADAIVDSAQSATVCLTMQTEGTPTENARADLDSFDSDGFTLDWEVADATARQVLYLAFGSNAGGGVTAFPHHYYQQLRAM